MKKMIALIAGMLLVLPVLALADGGIVGDCVDCHTMHNSEQGTTNMLRGTVTATGDPIQNLLRMDCIACHAMPGAATATVTLPGGSVVPQVSQSSDTNLAGGNFRYSTENQRHGHNVIDLTAADSSNAGTVGTSEYGAPPGNSHGDHHGLEDGVFSVSTAFDAFTCAGARGCHGTRSQVLPGTTADHDANAATANTWDGVRRTGISAVSGAHHNSYDGAKTSTGYVGESAHDGAVVAAGYRFIPGLEGYGIEGDSATVRWRNLDENSHNEYFAAANDGEVENGGCGVCHQEGTAGTDAQGNPVGGFGSRAATTSYLKVPGNDMSGFCASCHGIFHSQGEDNGTSGAFLRHPSDWVIPASGEYAAYTTYDITAPVARPSVYTAADSTVTPGTDMVMCLSCHAAHATPYNYMLRFDYDVMTAGGYADIATATGDVSIDAGMGAGAGCLACHTTKGVLPENR